MFATQVDVIATTLDSDTWLQIREINTFNRVLTFKNLTDTTLSIKVQHSVDGSTWTDHVTTFTLDSGDETVVAITSLNLLRVVGSGKTDSKGLMVGYSRVHSDTQYIWQSPVI